MQSVHETKGIKTEMSTHVNNEVPDVGTAGSSPHNAAAQNNHQNVLRSPSPNHGLIQQEASQNAAVFNNYQNILRSSSANQGLLQQENAVALNNYQNMLRSSSANQSSMLHQEASSIFRGPTVVHSGIQLEASRSFRAAQLGPMSFQQVMPQYQQNNFGAGVSQQYQQHVMQQLLQEANRSTNSRVLSQQQQPPSTPNASGGLAITSSGASGDQAQHMSNNGAAKGAAAPMGPINLINSGAAGVVQRCSSFKSVTSNPVAAGNPPTPKAAESMHEMDELDHLITSELAESGLFMGEQQGGGGSYSWHM